MSLIPEDESPPPADWIVTYGDMMSLLLTFFIMLVAMGEVKKQRYEMTVESIRRSFGNHADPSTPLINRFWIKNLGWSKLRSSGKAQRAEPWTGGQKEPSLQGDNPRTMIVRPGRDPTLGGMIYFDETGADLTDQHRQILKRTAALIRGKPQKVEIRGHTSSLPLPPECPYRSRWDLAYARCIHTLEYLMKQGVDPKRIRIGVAAQNEPLHRGHDPLLRKENSRVEIFLLDEFAEDLSS